MEMRWKVGLLLAILLPSIALAQKTQSDLKTKLEDAIETQEAGEEVTADVKAKIIKEAPEGVLPSGTGDVATTGAVQCDRQLVSDQCRISVKGLCAAHSY